MSEPKFRRGHKNRGKPRVPVVLSRFENRRMKSISRQLKLGRWDKADGLREKFTKIDFLINSCSVSKTASILLAIWSKLGLKYEIEKREEEKVETLSKTS